MGGAGIMQVEHTADCFGGTLGNNTLFLDYLATLYEMML